MEEITTLRKSQDTNQLGLTKIESNIQTYLTISPADLDPVCLKKQLEMLQTTSSSFIDIQQKLIDKMEGDDKETELERLDRHHEEYGSKRVRLQGLLHLYEANELADYIKELIEQLKSSGRDKAKTWGTTLQDLNEEIKRLTRLLTKPVAKTNAELKAKLRDYSAEIRSLKMVEMEVVTEASKDAAPTSSSPSSSTVGKVKLPELKLTPFNGNPLDWPSFWEEFSSAVHNIPELPESSKLAYLRSALKDETAIKIAAPSTGYTASYGFVVEKLKKQYERKPLIHRKHVLSLASLSKFSSSTYKGLLDMRIDIDKHIAGLKRLEQFDVDHLLASLIVNQFEPKLLDRWQAYSSEHGKELIIADVLQFMDVTLSSWMHTDESVSKTANRGTKSVQKKQSRTPIYLTETTSRNCELCSDTYHPPYVCATFRGMPMEQRQAHVQKSRLCRNCLGHGHSTKFCRSTYSCKKCGRKHHTLLHREDSPPTTTINTQPPPTPTNTNPPAASNVAVPGTARVNNKHSSSSTTLFMTCQVRVQTPNGHTATARALLDTGSSTSFITTRLSNTLQAKKIPSLTRIAGIQGAEAPSSSYRTTVQLVPSVKNAQGVALSPAIVDKITVDLPTQHAVADDISILKTLQLADPLFNRPGKIDMLLGMDIYQSVVHSEILKLSSTLTAQYSIFGWLIYGQAASGETQTASVHLTLHSVSEDSSDQLLKAFWEVEEVHAPKDSYTSEEQLALDHYEKTTTKTSGGMYQVKLPRRPDAPTLGESRRQAERRLVSTEMSLKRKGKWKSFQEVVNDYFTSGHAEPVPEVDMKKSTSSVFYLPMHGVSKQSSTTTKLRAVFDGSAATSTGVSLNDLLLPGPNVYSPLPDILLRFRLHKIGLTADVSKMFRMIELHPSDRDLHRFLWKSESGHITDFRMTRLTFGVTSSPFIAAQTLRRIATDNAEQYPQAAEVVLKNFYMDDCLTGAESVEEASELREQLNSLLERGNMQLRKWRSSSRSVINSVPDELREQEEVQKLPTPSELHKALGIHWDTGRDTLHVSTSAVKHSTDLTKRNLTSDIARTFDVLGWFAPAILLLKLLLQRLWELQIAWDDPVPSDIANTWQSWRDQLPALTEKPIPRRYFSLDQDRISVQLHGFADASELAYAAVVYIRTVYYDTTTEVKLVIAKTRVSPLKRLTIPRLELCAAQLLAKLLDVTRRALSIPLHDVYCWTDSMIVLAWLDGQPRRYKTYVGNRVSSTLQLMPSEKWHHVPTETNPADCASRGLLPSNLLQHNLWWNGPPWLGKPPDHWPSMPQDSTPEELMEMKTVSYLAATADITWLLERYSSYHDLRTTVARILRFYHNCKLRPEARLLSRHLSMEEIQSAEELLWRLSQETTFSEQLQRLKKGKELATSDPLLSLHPFVDKHGVLRVGGRLQRSKLKYSQRHPVVLDRKDPLTHLIVQYLHTTSCHAGPTLLLSILNRSFHVIAGKRLVRDICRKCVICRKQSQMVAEQQMGQLPPQRITPNNVFSTVGVDYAGPFLVKRGNPRKPVMVKNYLCVFVDFVVKAVHLELVTDLTAEAFVATLRRFVSRRGKPKEIFSDNGTNFVGAERDLRELHQLLQERPLQDAVHFYCLHQGIQWHFSPERAPHHGGLWEAAVKSAKSLLKKTVGLHKLTYEELYTVITQVESCLNSRPLVPFDSPNDDGLDVLTPGHFLIGRLLEALPDSGDVKEQPSALKRWNLCQLIVREFWHRWSTEYIQILNKSNKWNRSRENLQVGDIVLIRDSSLFRNAWPLGRIVETYPGPDGRVRVVLVKTAKSLLRRPICNLVLLLKESEKDEQSPPLGPRDVGAS